MGSLSTLYGHSLSLLDTLLRVYSINASSALLRPRPKQASLPVSPAVPHDASVYSSGDCTTLALASGHFGCPACEFLGRVSSLSSLPKIPGMLTSPGQRGSIDCLSIQPLVCGPTVVLTLLHPFSLDILKSRANESFDAALENLITK